MQTRHRLELLDKVEDLNKKYEGYGTKELLDDLVNREFKNEIAVISSFGVESAVLLHHISEVSTEIPIYFLDTLKHFSSTLEYRDELGKKLSLNNIKVTFPDANKLEIEDPTGDLHLSDPDLCCHIRKTLPMLKALNKYSIFITGRKSFQTPGRETMRLFESKDHWIKVNPLIDFDLESLENYFKANNLIAHPLKSQGFNSVGCEPCTVKSDKYRSGRWTNSEKTECGIHLGTKKES